MNPEELRYLQVRTTAVAADVLGVLLEERGALGWATDRKRGARLVHLKAYFDSEAVGLLDWIGRKIHELRANGVPVGPGEARWLPLRREDWADSWKRHFKPIPVTPHLMVCPSWEECPEGEEDRIWIDPGMAFGLGDHPSTRGCLQMMERLQERGQAESVGPYRVADVGTGTGILAIRAVQLGLGPVEAFDTDVEAIAAARANAERNGVTRMILFRSGTIPTKGAGPYGIVLANLYLTALESLLPRMTRAIAARGALMVAGILEEQEERVRIGAARRGLRVVSRICDPAQPGGRRWPVLLLQKA